MSKFARGVFTPKHPKKYIGAGKIHYRSSWEFSFMSFLDKNDNILYWASESIKIPYRHPFTGKMTIYVPDFFIVYKDRRGKTMAEIVEIKPKKQSVVEGKMKEKERAVVAVNHCKWDAARAYCRANRYGFRVITEDQLFRNARKS